MLHVLRIVLQLALGTAIGTQAAVTVLGVAKGLAAERRSRSA